MQKLRFYQVPRMFLTCRMTSNLVQVTEWVDMENLAIILGRGHLQCKFCQTSGVLIFQNQLSGQNIGQIKGKN